MIYSTRFYAKKNRAYIFNLPKTVKKIKTLIKNKLYENSNYNTRLICGCADNSRYMESNCSWLSARKIIVNEV